MLCQVNLQVQVVISLTGSCKDITPSAFVESYNCVNLEGARPSCFLITAIEVQRNVNREHVKCAIIQLKLSL